ncbi:response regulator, partial [Vibrio anguillarum]
MKILVIDDLAENPEHTRTRLLNVLEQRESIEVTMIEPKEEALQENLRSIDEFDLILVDYKFDTAISPIFRTGASLYSLLRDYTKSIPIYLISVLSKYRTNKLGEFDLFVNNEFVEDHRIFKYEIVEHKKLAQCSDFSQFVELLGAPDEVLDDLNSLLRTFFINTSAELNTTDDTVSFSEDLNIRLFHWLVESFLKKEGPLVSREGAALLLGVSTEYFRQILDRFEVAKYRGLFADSNEERWWASTIEDCVLFMEDEEDLLSKHPFKQAASLLLGASSSNEFSECIECDERYPDALGFLRDDENKKLHHVHMSCSIPDETLKQEVLF